MVIKSTTGDRVTGTVAIAHGRLEAPTVGSTLPSGGMG
jgi:hypothetical protein